MSTSGSKLIVLKSNDGEIFEVEEAVAVESQTIKNMVEDVSTDDVIPLPNVDGKILSMVFEYCKKHAHTTAPDDSERSEEELKEFDSEFVKGVKWNTLIELVLAANYLNIKGLLDLICQTIADKVKDKSVEEIREIFDIENDFTREEEEAVRKENQWAFE